MNTFRFFPGRMAAAALALASLASLRAVEVRFLSWEGQEDGLKFVSKGETVSISANENTLSPVYKFDDAGPLVLFRETTSGGKTVRATAAKLVAPADCTQALVLLTAADKSLASYTGVWIDDSASARPAGTVFMLNRSSHPVSVKMDSDGFTLAPDEGRRTAFSQEVNRVMVQADAKVGDRWARVIGNPLPVRPGVRIFLLLRDGRPQPGLTTNLVDMLSFYDRPAANPPPAPR